jgi:selenium-dependent xanthine dehydrogenase
MENGKRQNPQGNLSNEKFDKRGGRMYEFVVNGKKVQTDENKKLMEFLRDDLHLTSVKDGCSEGACGTCTVLIDGQKKKSCVVPLAKVDGKSIVTIEGLTERERDVYAWAFAEAGAVQCGFCIPGMVISAKSLLDENLEPSSADVKKAIKGNICRCTGYVKIEEAILMAAKIFREKTQVPKVECKGLVGDNLKRVDARDKVLGDAIYTNDMYPEGMLYGGAYRLECARALVKKIDISKALEHPEVEAIVTAKDIPGKRYIGHIIKDWPAFVAEGEETRYVGDALVAIAAKTKQGLKEALSLVEVDYDELEPITSPEMALRADAPNIHEKGNVLTKEVLVRGEVDEAIKNSKYVVTHHYSLPFTEHAFLETESALAIREGDDGIAIYTTFQGIYDVKKECAELLGLEPEKVRAVCKYVGGGFGGKEDITVQHHASLLAWVTHKPVKVTLSRKESIRIHPKRHAMEMDFTTACDENGYLTAMRAELVADTGAYASLGGPVLQRACTHAAGPYNYQNSEVIGTAVYTNNPPGGAFRGFGVTQSAFATECNLNELADLVGISHWEIRYRNAIEPGQVLPNGQIADEGTALKETLLSVKDFCENEPYVGVASAFKNSGIGVGLPDVGRCKLFIDNGIIEIRAGAVCMGQGMATILIQIVCETVEVSPDCVRFAEPDTSLAPDSGMSTASRQTLFTGEATHQASLNLKAALNEKTLDELNGEIFYGEYFGKTDPMGSEKENPKSHIAYGYATHAVALDENGKIKKVVASHDVGRAINPRNIEGQIEGGVVMSLGYALTEDFPLKDGIPTAKFGTLGLFRSTDVPEIESIIIEKNPSPLAYGAKGIGEISSIPTPPAIQGAYMKLDGKFRTSLPLDETAYRKKK